ncbi:PEP-CTERM sorting domain-containing protein [Cerasicoccus frondis]|uniref:PEP-CTERM sorting domain-containing protein n=1 Tax=Cerasicoccus frondis TaxID=490090 RepID=UPI0028525CEC|nr:PEP-CTERM sorting domain-containing protein [Cerasicoccus frondis]
MAQTSWTNAGGDSLISNSSNWDNGLPSLSSLGTIDNGDTVEMTERQQLDNKDYLVTNGSTIHVDSGINGVRWDGGSITLTGGNLDSDYTSLFTIGRDSDANPTTLNINDGSTATFAGALIVGRLSQGFVNQSGNSTVTIDGTLRLQENSNTVVSGNIYNLSGGSVTATDLDVRDRNLDNSNYFNFTSGSTGQLTIVGASIFDFDAYITDGRIRLNDNPNSDTGDFSVSSEVIGPDTFTTLSLTTVPEPSSYALMAGAAISGIILLRRQRGLSGQIK